MMPPASEMVIRSSTLTGYIENATANLPEFTSFSSSAGPLAPPTKSMRLSVRTSPIPSTGASSVSCRRLTSRRSAARSPRRDFPERDRVPPAAEEHRDLATPGGGSGPIRHREPLPQRRQQRFRRERAQVLDHAVVGQDLHLVAGKGDGEERIPVTRGAVGAAQLLTGARRTRRPVMTVRDVERRDRIERRDELALGARVHRPDRVLDAVRRREPRRAAARWWSARPRHPRLRKPCRSGTRGRSAPAARACGASGRLPCRAASARAS